MKAFTTLGVGQVETLSERISALAGAIVGVAQGMTMIITLEDFMLR
jgi:hypothetical protein